MVGNSAMVNKPSSSLNSSTAAPSAKLLNMVTVTAADKIEGANNKIRKIPAPGNFLNMYKEKIKAKEIPTKVTIMKEITEFLIVVPKISWFCNIRYNSLKLPKPLPT